VGLHDRQELVQALERNRLTDEVERAQAQAFARLSLGGDARDGHDRQAGLADGTQLQEIESAHAGQVDVEQDGVRKLALQRAQRRLGAAHDHRLVPYLCEEVAEDLAESVFILDDEDSHDLSWSLARRSAYPSLRRTHART
jgi:hypothetical protein